MPFIYVDLKSQPETLNIKRNNPCNNMANHSPTSGFSEDPLRLSLARFLRTGPAFFPDDDGLLRAGLVTEDFFSFAADCLRVVTMMIILAGRVRVCVYEANRLKHNVSVYKCILNYTKVLTSYV